MKVTALLALLLLLVASGAQAGTIIVDRPSLDALIGGGGTTIDFEVLSVGVAEGQTLSSPLLTLSGVTFTGGVLQANGPGYYGAPSKELLAGSSPYNFYLYNTLVADFAASVNAFGVDLRAFAGFPNTAAVTVYSADDSTVLATISEIELSTSGVPVFFGFQDAVGIGKVHFDQVPEDRWSPIIDNFTYGSVASSTVPLPSAAWLGLGLLGLLGAARRMRRKA